MFYQRKKMSNFSGKKKSLSTKEHNWFHILLYRSAVRKALLTYVSRGISSNPKSRPLFPFLSLFLSTSTNLVNKTFLLHSYSNYRSWFKIPLKLANSKELLKKRTLRTYLRHFPLILCSFVKQTFSSFQTQHNSFFSRP